MKSLLKTVAVAAFGFVAVTGVAEARDQIKIVGSSTVFPFSTAVAENFGKKTSFKTPVVESTGSGGGLKLFCAGVGVEHPDITNASRKIKSSEVENCASNGVTDVIEMKVGYDGIVLGNSKSGPQMNITRKELWLALSATVPDGNGGFQENPYTTWSEINSSLPNTKIEVLGPPPTSGTRDAFVEIVMEHGAEEFPEVKALGKDDFKATALRIREDGAFIEAGENDNLIVQKLEANPDAFGIFGFSFLDQNADKIQGATVEGEDPTFDNIASGAYPVSRSLWFYVKKAHVGVIPGIEEYLAEFTADSTWGEYGYLADKGLIPMPEAERAKYKAAAEGLAPMTN